MSHARHRVVLLSIDGGGSQIVQRLLASGALKGGAFDGIASRGVAAEGMRPPDVASTPVSHATIYTGTWPSTHGVTGVGLPGESISAPARSGFTIPTSVDRLWTVAQQAGRRVLCFGAVGADAMSPATTCTYTVPFAAMTGPVAGRPKLTGDTTLNDIERAIGVSPGGPDSRRVTSGELSEAQYVSDATRFAEFQGRAVLRELARRDWDLLIVYMPLMDNLQHRYLLTDPRQSEYGDESGARRARFGRYIEDGWRAVDRILASWLAAAPDTNFVVVGDHGMTPIHSVVVLNNVLASAGLKVGGPDADVRALSSGGSAQIYVNSARRFSKGSVPDDQVSSIVGRVEAACSAVVDPVTGKRVFVKVSSPPPALAHPAAGEVFVVADHGWGVTGRFEPKVPWFVPSSLSPDARQRISRSPEEERFLADGGLNELSLGIHGARPADPDVRAMFLAIGPDVPRARRGIVAMTDVAPTVLGLLGVPSPAWVTGRKVF